MNKTAILFDADGVLIQSKPFTFHLEEQHGISTTVMAEFFKQRFPGCLIGTHDLKEELKAFLPGTSWSGTVEEFMDFWFEVENCPDRALLPEIARLRERGYYVGVATNQERYRVAFMRERMAFDSTFDAVFASCDIGQKKPAPGFYDAVSERLRSQGIERVVFFDDRADNVEGARHAGWDAHLYESLEDFMRWAENE